MLCSERYAENFLVKSRTHVGDSKLTGGIRVCLLTTTMLHGNKELPKLVFIIIFNHERFIVREKEVATICIDRPFYEIGLVGVLRIIEIECFCKKSVVSRVDMEM